MPEPERPSNAPAGPEWVRYSGPVRTLVLLNSLLAFVLEMAMFAFVVWWVLTLDLALWARIPLAVAAFGGLATLWGLLVSPRARYPLPTAWTVVFKLAAYGGSALALWGVGYPAAAVAFAVLAAANTAVITYVRTRPAI
ncbi:YrdB family protein [Glycomyces luteolus]|uniref:YrdB family protein n=1 Tax=Glycomyces luteolus TaxID=2670330 RepID=A0A9X3P628_9ACTN|nr:YrdB family protein [Glycomyces luteolus]MDA1358261.1 YrdB family protein [Glycomyces luteolus]